MKKLYVGNLPYSATGDDLQKLFSEVGAVLSATVISDKYSGQSKGFGFVEMANDNEADEAIKKFSGYEFNGRKLVVNEARPQEKREFGGAGGGNRNFGDRGPRRDNNFSRGGGRRFDR